MSSTTEESDWNMSPKSRGLHSLSKSDTGRPTSQPVPLPHQSPRYGDSSTLSTPRAGSFASTAAQLESQLFQTVAATTAPVQIDRASLPISIPPATEVPTTIDQNTAEWEAARESVLSQMVTSQDLVATPTPIAKVTRGGVKTGGRRGRGGRRPKVKIEGADGITAEIAAAAGVKVEDTPTRGKNKGGRPRGSRAGVNRGGRPRGTTVNKGGRPRGSKAGSSAAGLLGHVVKKKRKRDDDDENEKDDTDASEEFTPLTQTSSGRRITQAKTFSPIVLDLTTTTSARKPAQKSTAAEPPSTAKKPAKRRKAGEAAVCINCGRGHSPNSNQIVFCDGCNTPWHQMCHDRPITPSVIQFEEKEWICTDCKTVREEKEHITGKISAERMSLAEKRTYLKGLEKNELVSLLLHASSLHEDLPIFMPPPPNPVPVIVEPRPIHVAAQAPTDEEEVYEIYVEAEPLPYPKPGNGIVLPPEEDDLDLLIDEDIVTYSHLWKGPRGWEGPGGMVWPYPENGIGRAAPTITVGA